MVPLAPRHRSLRVLCIEEDDVQRKLLQALANRLAQVGQTLANVLGETLLPRSKRLRDCLSLLELVIGQPGVAAKNSRD